MAKVNKGKKGGKGNTKTKTTNGRSRTRPKT
jgi:hypothetical protein